MKSEPLLEGWPGSLSDAVFVEDGTGDPRLLLGGNHVWWVPDEEDAGSGYAGWDTPDHQDLDPVPFTLAFDGTDGGPAFQDGQMRAVTTFPGGTSDIGRSFDLLVSANGDYKSFHLYGGDPAYRPPASRPCNFQMTDVVNVDVAGWSDPEDPATRQVWLIGNVPNSNWDNVLGRGLFLSRDGSDTYCWDGMSDDDPYASQLALGNFLRPDPTSGEWLLHCQDQGLDLVDSSSAAVAAKPAWEACKTDIFSEPFGMDIGPSAGDQVGQPRRIAALGEGVAVMATSKACQSDLGIGCAEVDAVGEGLWVVRDGGASGLSYTKVVLPTGGDCDESELFAYSGLHGLAVHPSSGSGTGDGVDVFLTSRDADCGLVEITFTLGSEDTSATLDTISTVADTEAGGEDDDADCAISPSVTYGVEVSPDGTWLFVYGGEAHYTGTYSDGGVCAIDLTASYTTGAGQEQAVPLGARDSPSIPSCRIRTSKASHGSRGGLTRDVFRCMPTGIYELQHRYKPATDSWAWGSRRISGDDLGFKGVWDMTWGGGGDVDVDSPYLMDLYIATTASGFWDGAVEW